MPCWVDGLPSTSKEDSATFSSKPIALIKKLVPDALKRGLRGRARPTPEDFLKTSPPASSPQDGSEVTLRPTPYEILADSLVTPRVEWPRPARWRSCVSFAATRSEARTVAMSRLVSEALGLDSPHGLTAAGSLAELCQAQDVAPLVRAYAVGFKPRELLTNTKGLAEAARVDRKQGFECFRTVIARNQPIRHDALKAHLLLMLVEVWGAEVLSGQAAMAALNQIIHGAKVVEGDTTADTKFEFGREAILEIVEAGSLALVFFHELGHYQNDMGFPEVTTSLADGPQLARELAEVLPDLIEAAAIAALAQPEPDLSAGHRVLPGGLSVNCTCMPFGSGAYTHLSLSDAGTPIALDTALTPARIAVRLLDADASGVALAWSARGYLHIGVLGASPDPEQMRNRAARLDTEVSGNPRGPDATHCDQRPRRNWPGGPVRDRRAEYLRPPSGAAHQGLCL